MGNIVRHQEALDSAGAKQETVVQKLYRIELEDLSEYRGSLVRYYLGDSEIEALIGLLDEMDLQVSITPAKDTPKQEVADSAKSAACGCFYQQCGCDDPAPLSKLRRLL